jgi:hypothetical protein
MRHLTRLRPRLFLLTLFVLSLAAPGHDATVKATRGPAPAPAPQTTNPGTVGQWGTQTLLDEVPVHISVLPDGRLLYWGRDKHPVDKWDIAGSCKTYTWNPTTNARAMFPNNTTNLFCSGHSFLPDGRLLVAGGHDRYEPTPDREAIGERDLNVFDYRNNSWTRVGFMPRGRWYPSTVTMANGEVMIFAGSYWNGTSFRTLPDGRSVPSTIDNTVPDMYTLQGTVREFTAVRQLPLYPYLHLSPTNGQVFLAGPGPNVSRFFDPNGNTGNGQFHSNFDFGDDHLEASSVLYDSAAGKVLMVGGRHALGGATTDSTDVIDLTSNPFWRTLGSRLAQRRKYHNATLLPDGKVLVTGGTQCTGANNITCMQDAFGNYTGAATRPELFDPQTEIWTTMAPSPARAGYPNGVPRIYHSVGLLLPDARVLVGGGGLPYGGGEVANGELCVDGAPASASINCRTAGHKDVEIYSPPYLFTSTGALAARPTISAAPASVTLGQTFNITTSSAFQTSSVVLIRLPSVTHGTNFDQRRVVLNFTATSSTNLSATLTADGRVCPPGPYMLFILNSAGVPSVSRMVNVSTGNAITFPNQGNRVVVNADGRMHVFFRGADGALNYRAQATPGSVTWSAAVSLGGVITSNPVAVHNADGRLEVFAKGTDNALYNNRQLTAGGSSWSGWARLGGVAAGDPAVARNNDGRLQVFYRGGDSQLYTVTQTAANATTWTAHVSLSGVLISNPAVVANADGRLEVFAVLSNNAVNHIWQNAAGSSSWSGWFTIFSFTSAQNLAVAPNLDGMLQVFYRSGSGIETLKQTPGAPGGWSSPISLGGAAASDPTVGVNADGRLEVFVKATDNSLHHIWQTAPNGNTFSGWAGLGGFLTSGAPATRQADGRLIVVVRGADNATLYQNTQASPSSSASWAGFGLVGGHASTF